MGCWDIYCPLCGNAPTSVPIQSGNECNLDEGTYRDMLKKMKWLGECYFMTITNQVYKNCKEYSCNIEFRCKSKPDIHLLSIPNVKELKWGDEVGYFIHADCFRFVKKHYNHSLVLGDFYIKKQKDLNQIQPPYARCHQIKKYQKQFFDYCRLYQDGLFWMAESPLHNKQNARRIMNVLNKMKWKKGRKSPSLSATLFPKKTYKVGNDGYIWVVENNKWQRINVSPMEEEIKRSESVLRTIPTICFSHTKPIFIKKISPKVITTISLPHIL